jgi:hypothetical protein
MNCLDCLETETAAVTVCGRCGAGLCRTHLIETDEHLTIRMPINRQVPVSPPARRLRCHRCAAAETAQGHTSR